MFSFVTLNFSGGVCIRKKNYKVVYSFFLYIIIVSEKYIGHCSFDFTSNVMISPKFILSRLYLWSIVEHLRDNLLQVISIFYYIS